MARTPPTLASATPLRPATYAGIAAALVSITAAVLIRIAPTSETVVAVVHFILTFAIYVMGGALAARLGGQGWRAGLFAGLLDALIGHAISYVVARPLDPSRVSPRPGVEVTPQLLHAMQLWGAVFGAAVTVVIAMAGGALGGWYARKTGVAPTRVSP